MTHIRCIELASRSDLFPVFVTVHYAPRADWDIRQIEIATGPNGQGMLDADVQFDDLPISTQHLLLAALDEHVAAKDQREHGLRRLLADIKADAVT